MKIESMNSFGNAQDSDAVKYLDRTELIEGQSYERLAFVANNNSGIDRNENGFFTFYLKTIDNAILTAQLFNVNDFVRSGGIAKMLIHKPVKVSFIAQIYRGRWSLLLKDIKLWNGEFNTSLFLGKIKVDTDKILSASRKTEVFIDVASWEEASFSSLADGNAGAFAIMANAVLEHARNYVDLWGVEYEMFTTVILHTLKTLYIKYSLQEEMPFVPVNDISEKIYTQLSGITDKTIKAVCFESCSAIAGLCKPQHLYAILANRLINETITDLHLIYTCKGMPLGAITTVDGVQLVRY
jgi:hypothetical protein